jgi:8-oxo-dGTP pyrophosphatase MutT (NUDIX family)
MLSWIQRQVGQFAFAGTMAGKAILAPVALGAHAMLVTPEGKVVLARHSYKSGWSFPGGGVGRGEAPVEALLRELREEIGVVRSDPPLFFGLYSRRSGWATNVIVLYCLMNAEVEFRANFEVREITFADPANPPQGTSPGTARRLAEHIGKTPPNPYW